jgi:lipopolysaccharide transport system ATP-binding protein
MNNSETAIKVEKISKIYRIGLKEEMADTFGGIILDVIRSPLKNYQKYRSLYSFRDIKLNRDRESNNNSKDIIWALRDVSFEVKRGEVLGIIGRNGAGKSTLLKILSRITDPTLGRAEVHGRISSLLEVGTGFHQELTGRENVYLNGTILGMKKKELDIRFDEIVDFSGVEKFIDTPVKRYSSGMMVRLAFSVAAHLEPEILLVDEVLAVGDADFQRKCLTKMEDVGHEGRTVLFVSHNMAAITRLCQRAIFLDEGQVKKDGPAHQVVSEYLNPAGGTSAEHEWPDPLRAPGGDIARLRTVRVKTENGQVQDRVDIRKPLWVEMEYDVITPGHLMIPNFQFFNEAGLEIISTIDRDPAWRHRPRPRGRYLSRVMIPGNLLAEGVHYVRASLATRNPFKNQFNEPNTVAFQVVDHFEGDSARGDWPFTVGGVVRPLLQWNTQFEPDTK